MKNKRVNLVSVLILTLSALSVSVSYASTFDFTEANLSKSAGSAYSSVGMSSDGLDLTVQAYRIYNDGNGNITNKRLINEAGNTHLGVYLESNAGHGDSLGVWSGNGGGNLIGGSSTSTYADEGLLFTFSQKVSLDYINLDYFNLGNDRSDDFNITVDGITFIVDYWAGAALNPYVTSTDGQQDHFLFSGLVGKEFLIWADGGSDTFTISDLKVSAVPLPAAIWLMGPALFGIFSLSGKRKQEV